MAELDDLLLLRGLRQGTYSGSGFGFARAIQPLRLRDDITFGTGATGPTPIRNAAELSARYRPLQGEFAADGTHLGGAGPTTINSEPQNYRNSFSGSPNHIFDVDGLRLQPKVEAGDWTPLAYGNLLSSASTGMIINAPGGTNPSPIGDLGLVSADLDSIEVGTILNAANSGWAVVSAKDKPNGTITIEDITTGARTAKSNYHLTFLRAAFCRIALGATVANGDTNVPLAKALPSYVVTGMILRHCLRANGASTGSQPSSNGDMRITSIASDRMSFTVADGVKLGTGNSLVGNNFGGFMVLPGTSSGQICSRDGYGSHLVDLVGGGRLRERAIMAMSFDATMPVQTWPAPTDLYSRTQFADFLANNPSVAFGYWPAGWLYSFRPGPGGDGQDPDLTKRRPVTEIDNFEMFGRGSSGGRVLTCYNHSQGYARRRLTTGDSSNVDRHRNFPATWRTEAATTKELTPNAGGLIFDTNLTDGQKHSYGLVMTNNKLIHYFDGLPVCEDDWSIETEYPLQFIFNVACGMMTNAQAPARFLPQNNAAAEQPFKIHRFQHWTLF